MGVEGLRVSANALYDCYSRIVGSFISIHWWSRLFFPVKGYCVLYDKQNTRLLVDKEFLFECSTRHLTRSLHSLVTYRVKHSKRNSISTRAHVLFSIYQVHQGHCSIFLKSPLLLCKNSFKFETFAIVNGAIFFGTSRVEPPNRMSYVYVFSTAIVCRSRHDFLTYSLLEYVPFLFS